MNTHILIVEDDKAISALIKIHLNMVDYKTTQVYNGLDVLPILEKEHIDLVLLDIMLPGLDGFTLLERIKSYHIPVIFLTAKNTITDKVTGLKSGAEDYIVKPLSCLLV